MSQVIVHKPDDYEVVEKVGKTYHLHIFESREQFTAWRQKNPHLKVKVRKPKNRVRMAVDHRCEFVL